MMAPYMRRNMLAHRSQSQERGTRQKKTPWTLVHRVFRERETRFELATSTLARLHSTAELLPLRVRVFSELSFLCQAGIAGFGRIRFAC